MSRIRAQWDHVKSVIQISRHFENPLLIVLLRLGIIKLPYFCFRIRNGSHRYTMMARPTATSEADLFVLREVLVNEAYAGVLPLVNKQIRLLDIGANLGSFTIWAHRHLGVREAFCFEPEPDSFRLLNLNLSLNNCPAARTFECAMGGEARTINIVLKKSSPGGTNIYGDNAASPEARPVPVLAFEKWLQGIEGDFDLLKMDCEGAEWEIIRRTDSKHFRRFRVMVAEVHGDPENKQPVSDFKPMMEGLGYRTVRWDDQSHGLYIGVRE